MPDRLSSLLESVGSPRILVVGDMMLDRYVWGEAGRISPEGPIPVLRIASEELRAGGAGNVVLALLRLGAEVAACGVIGDDAPGVLLKEELEEFGGDSTGILVAPDRPTTQKTRYFGYVQSAHRGVQHMLRVDQESVTDVDEATEAGLLEKIEALLPDRDAVVLSDYEKGLLTDRVLERTIALARQRNIPIITDPKVGRPYTAYRHSTVITPNRYETQVATGIAPQEAASRKAAAEKLLELTDAEHVIITLDRDGMFLAGRDGSATLLPTHPREVVDVTGAGDMVVSVLALMLASSAPVEAGAQLANVAAGIAVSRVGAAPVSRDEIQAELYSDGARTKLKSLDEAVTLAGETRRRNGKVVWTNGCFDLFHIGHYEYLKFAAKQGDLLIVGINSDESARRVKGAGRPITGEMERARVLAALDVVDAIVIFEEETPARQIEAIRPEVLVKGADYRLEDVVGHEQVESWGGRVALAPIVEGFSTTELVNRILKMHGNNAGEPPEQ